MSLEQASDMEQEQVNQLAALRQQIAVQIDNHAEADFAVLAELLIQRDTLLRHFCAKEADKLKYQQLLLEELALTEQWHTILHSYSSELSNSLLQLARNQRALQAYRT